MRMSGIARMDGDGADAEDWMADVDVTASANRAGRGRASWRREDSRGRGRGRCGSARRGRVVQLAHPELAARRAGEDVIGIARVHGERDHLPADPRAPTSPTGPRTPGIRARRAPGPPAKSAADSKPARPARDRKVFIRPGGSASWRFSFPAMSYQADRAERVQGGVGHLRERTGMGSRIRRIILLDEAVEGLSQPRVRGSPTKEKGSA